MIQRLKTLLIGRRLANEELQGETLNVFWGLPIMASDAISSVAYGVEEMLWVLVPLVGAAAYQDMLFVAVAIIVLLLVLVFSYRQTIDNYPHGGGSYTVAWENLGELPGLVACASLFIDYILTVAVSTTAGTAAITSAVPALLPFHVVITLVLIGLMTIGNLRGVKESARLFAIPTYIFIGSILLMIVTGLVKTFVSGGAPVGAVALPEMAQDVTLFLLVRTFAAGCAGLSGIEAVSNAIPNFAPPSQKNAKRVLMLLALCVLLIFGGTSYMATLYHAVPSYSVTVLSQISLQVFGEGFLFYFLQATTAVILVMAANTSYAGLPMLLSLVAKDGYMPRQFSTRGGRLSFSNGIVVLGIAASILVVLYQGNTHDLVPLYSVGVFLSFTLSQLGMLVKWVKSKESGRLHKAVINGLGAIMTAITVVIIIYSKMAAGAWVSLLLIVILVVLMKIIQRHYRSVAQQLKLTQEEARTGVSTGGVQSHIIVVVNSLNKSSLKAIRYARQLSGDRNIVAFHISIDKESAAALEAKWADYHIPVPLVVKYSPYREIVAPLVAYVKSDEHASHPGDLITVVMPQFVVNKPWQNILHNQMGFLIRKKLLRERHIAVVTVPFVLSA